MTGEQKKTPLTEKPKFTLEDVAMKIKALERELNYLIGKVKSFRPKTKPKETVNKTEGANDTKSTKAGLCQWSVVLVELNHHHHCVFENGHFLID